MLGLVSGRQHLSCVFPQHGCCAEQAGGLDQLSLTGGYLAEPLQAVAGAPLRRLALG